MAEAHHQQALELARAIGTIAEAHGGTLDLRARPAGGLRVCVDLPAAAATAPAAVPAKVPA